MVKDKIDSLGLVELKAFIPCKDFRLSKQFYTAIGFTIKSEVGGVAYFNRDNCSFLLQDFYQEQLCNNLMMHLQVVDARAWHQQISSIDLTCSEASLSEITEQPWGMLDFVVTDPSGVLWRIGQNISQ